MKLSDARQRISSRLCYSEPAASSRPVLLMKNDQPQPCYPLTPLLSFLHSQINRVELRKILTSLTSLFQSQQFSSEASLVLWSQHYRKDERLSINGSKRREQNPLSNPLIKLPHPSSSYVDKIDGLESDDTSL